MRKYGWELSTLHCRESENTYWLTLWCQSLYRWWMFRAYDWYSMRIYKVKGFKALEKHLSRRWHRKHPNDWAYIPLSAKQDCRAYDLQERSRVALATLEISKETYDKLNGRSA